MVPSLRFDEHFFQIIYCFDALENRFIMFDSSHARKTGSRWAAEIYVFLDKSFFTKRLLPIEEKRTVERGKKHAYAAILSVFFFFFF